MTGATKTSSAVGKLLGRCACLVLFTASVTACTESRPSSGTTTQSVRATSSTSATPTMKLPQVPWEGGPEYWTRFAAAKAAGWSDPSFFPIGIWFDAISTDEEVEFDKAQGINTYVAGSVSTPYRFFADHDVFWIGPRLQDTPAGDARNWVGVFLDDEVDGRFPPEEGLARLETMKKQVPAGRFSYANFTTLVVNQDFPVTAAERYVNDFADAVSTDMYWYTIPFCTRNPYYAPFVHAVPKKSCRTARSYGQVMDMLRLRDEADGKRQPLWQFVELLNGMGAQGPFITHIQPDQLRGAVMSSLIHEARGIVYFNQSLVGPCQGGNVIRLAQVEKNYCGAVQVAAAATVNKQIQQLAPVLNTQSYVYSFGTGLDTMLKAHDGNVYIFAMIDSSSSEPGRREFTLPPDVTGSEVEVLFENRTIPVKDGRFTDSFASEHSYHIYRLSMGS